MQDEMTLLLAKRGEVPRGAAFQAARRLGLSEFEWQDPSSGKTGRFHTRMAGEGLQLPRGTKESDLFRDPAQEKINRDYYDTTQAIERNYRQKMADIESQYALKGLEDQEARERKAESEGEAEYLRETAEPSDRAKINQLLRAKAQRSLEGLETQEGIEDWASKLGETKEQLAKLDRQIALLNSQAADQASDRAKIDAIQRANRLAIEQRQKAQALQGVYPELALVPLLRGLGALFRTSRTVPMRYYDRQEPNFAAGGLAGLAAQGRGGDTMLVHMSPDEVRNMQRMAMARGTTMTINPETGLPEAFNLRKLVRGLAALAPIAAAFFPPVAAAMPFLTTPVGAGLAGGIAGGLSGEKGFDLKRGLTSGLLAYGIGSAMKGLEAAGGAGSVASSGAEPAAQLASQEAIAASVPEAVPGFVTNSALSTDPLVAAAVQSNAQATAPIGAVALSPAEAAAFDLAGAGPAPVQGSAASGLSALVNPATTDAAQQAFMSQFGKGALYATGAGLIGTAALDEQEKQAQAAFEAGQISKQQYQEFMDRIAASRERAKYALRTTPYQFALGGEIDERYQLTTPEFGGKPMSERNAFGLARGGIATLPPRYLSGGGDGMSDSIPAKIGNNQPARLSDGEFVIPADVVSHLGNGSSKAGAKQLYSMMDRVRRARTGNPKQGREINAAQLMPA